MTHQEWFEMAKYIGAGGAFVLGVAVWWLAGQLKLQRADLKEEVTYSRMASKDTLTVLSAITSVIREGDALHLREGDKTVTALVELRRSVDLLSTNINTHFPAK